MKNLLSNAPIITEGVHDIDEELLQKLNSLREAILTNDATHLLNRENVKGLWLLTDLQFEEGKPQILLYSPLKSGELNRLKLASEIFEFIEHDVNYDYEDLFVGDTLIIGQQDKVLKEIESGRVLTVYDENR